MRRAVLIAASSVALWLSSGFVRYSIQKRTVLAVAESFTRHEVPRG